MVSGFELLGHNRALQTHWLRRMAAYAIDASLVLALSWLVMAVLGSADPVGLALVSGAVFAVYGTTSEAWHAKTAGKAALGLEVRALEGRLTLRKTFGRNAPKFFWYLFPALDVLLGLLGQGDPRQRFSDRAARTTVVWREAKPFRVRAKDVRRFAANR